MKKPLAWFPLYVDNWLLGSTRLEMTHEQRALWLDLLALSAKDQGYIRANEDVPYPVEQLAGFLMAPVGVLAATIEVCLDKGKLERLPNGTLHVTSWDRYKLTRQYRGRLEREQVKKNREDETRVEESRLKGNENSVSQNGTSVSKEGNSPTPNRQGQSQTPIDDSLPPIPRRAPFDTMKEMEDIRRQIVDAERKGKADQAVSLSKRYLKLHEFYEKNETDE